MRPEPPAADIDTTISAVIDARRPFDAACFFIER
jgi:hypothetical protein